MTLLSRTDEAINAIVLANLTNIASRRCMIARTRFHDCPDEIHNVALFAGYFGSGPACLARTSLREYHSVDPKLYPTRFMDAMSPLPILAVQR